MLYRNFGNTGLKISEVGFGAWPIGGTSYGAVDRKQSLAALARAEELGCNFVDTALVYGDSELVLGEFLRGRRDRWIVATKYSKQAPGMTATLENQLRRLGIDAVDYYQLHWTPRADHHHYYDELEALKKSGKARFIGVSLYAPGDIDYVLDHSGIDGIQVPFSLLDPDPFLARIARLRDSRLGIIIRSCLKEGFLTGKFGTNASFSDPKDQRSEWQPERIRKTLAQVKRFGFLENTDGTLTRGAVAYPLSFPEVSSVILGTKTPLQAQENFGAIPGARLDEAALERVRVVQDELDLRGRRTLKGLLKRLLGRG